MSDVREVLTIGHSNHTLEHFLGLLKANNVELLADVRTRPFASYSRHFDGEPLRVALEAAGIAYTFLGYGLGGKPHDLALYDEEGRVCYDRIAATKMFSQAFGKLEEALACFRVAIMCGEEDPYSCHRRLMVGRVLAEHGVRVLHVRGDGRIQTEADLRGEYEQATLFDAEDHADWRSHWKLSKTDRQKLAK